MKTIRIWLDLISDMYKFDRESSDLLNQVIGECTDSEDDALSLDDLDLISAATDCFKYEKDITD